MSGVLKISDAATLALHTTVLLADRTDGPLTTKEMASTFGVSEAHLAKVLQRLAKARIVLSGRGPKGGFLLAKPADRTTLLEVYEAIEGPLTDSDCLLGVPVCGGTHCILGSLVKNLNAQVRKYFSNTRLSDTTSAFKNLALYDRIMGTSARGNRAAAMTIFRSCSHPSSRRWQDALLPVRLCETALLFVAPQCPAVSWKRRRI